MHGCVLEARLTGCVWGETWLCPLTVTLRRTRIRGGSSVPSLSVREPSCPAF